MLVWGQLTVLQVWEPQQIYIRIVADETSDQHIPDTNFYFCYIPGIVLESGKTAMSNMGEASTLLIVDMAAEGIGF